MVNSLFKLITNTSVVTIIDLIKSVFIGQITLYKLLELKTNLFT